MKAKLYILISFLAAFMMSQTSAFAEVKFSDIQNHWGKKNITAMVEKKFILGYPDGTFKPDKEVTKLDTLILASRVLGVDNELNAKETISAENTYKTLLAKYNIYGKKEISFLLNRKVLISTELDAYLKGNNAKAYTKRYEAAIIFTKIMGKENDVKNKSFIILPFSDSQSIPRYAKPYVEFMNDQKIMQGVNKKEFQPNASLTRAQVAAILLRVSNMMRTQLAVEGTIRESDINNQVNKIEAENDTKIKNGIITEIYITKNPKLTILEGSKVVQYDMVTDALIKVNNKDSTIYDLRLGQKVEIIFDSNEITSVNAE